MVPQKLSCSILMLQKRTTESLLQQPQQITEDSSAERARLMKQETTNTIISINLRPVNKDKPLFKSIQGKSLPCCSIMIEDELPESSRHTLLAKETHPECLPHLSVLDTPVLLKTQVNTLKTKVSLQCF